LAFQCGHTDCHSLLVSFTSNDSAADLNGPASISTSASTKKKREKSVKNTENNGKSLKFQNYNEKYDSDSEKHHQKSDKRRDKIRYVM
jgi:hypothetical protein